MRRLKEVVGKRQLHEAYPTSFIDGSPTKNDEDAIAKLSTALRLLMEISECYKHDGEKHVKTNNLPKFFEIVNEEDFVDVKMWLSEKLWELSRKP